MWGKIVWLVFIYANGMFEYIHWVMDLMLWVGWFVGCLVGFLLFLALACHTLWGKSVYNTSSREAMAMSQKKYSVVLIGGSASSRSTVHKKTYGAPSPQKKQHDKWDTCFSWYLWYGPWWQCFWACCHVNVTGDYLDDSSLLNRKDGSSVRCLFADSWLDD